MVEVVVLLVAVIAGVLARGVGLPPMVGFLIAGFTLEPLARIWPGLSQLDFSPLVNFGFTLLLFTIGLKLEIRSLIRPFVWGVACLHMGVMIAMFFIVLLLLKVAGWAYLAELSSAQNLMIGFALSFSSTVFAVKVLEERGEMASLHGKVAIGILVMQDIFAVIYLSAIGDHLPSIYTPLLLLLISLRPLIHSFLERCGHGELLVLAGLMVAYAAYGLFELAGLKGDLGSLFIGAILAGTVRGKELAKSLLTIKDLLLVGFFLSIGQYGLPGGDAWLVALLFTALLFTKPVVYFLLFAKTRLRSQTALMGSLVLNHYSEFGLIVMAIAAEAGLLPTEWVVILAIALSLSFVLSSTINLYSDRIHSRFRDVLLRFQTEQRIAEQAPIDIGDASILVMGMGRLGTGAYDYLQNAYGPRVVGVEENEAKVREHLAFGRKIFTGDASDLELWQRLPRQNIKKIILALSNHSETVRVTEMLRECGFDGVIAAVAKFDDHLQELKNMGVIAFNFYAEAGAGFAEHVVSHLSDARS